MIYKKCPHCGANLDPGETCDCQDEEHEVDAQEARRPLRGRQLSMDALYARHMGIDREVYLR
nr:hypothetical protein [Clostridia bacterium]